MRWVLAWGLVACSGVPDLQDTGTLDAEVTPDSGGPVDSSSDSDSDAEDTDGRDTELDTGPPWITGGASPPMDLGPGFIEFGSSFWASSGLEFDPGDRTAGDSPTSVSVHAGDLDGDGVPEILVSDMRDPQSASPERAFMAVFRNDGVTWARDRDLEGAVGSLSRPLAAMDFDGDGHVDVLSANPRYAWSWGQGGGVFSVQGWLADSISGISGIADLGLADLDSDGWLDLIGNSGSCTGGLAVIPFLKRGPRRYTRRPGMVQAQAGMDPYAVVVGPLGEEDLVIAAFGTVCDFATPADAFLRPTSVDAEGYPVFEWFDPTPADSLYKQSPSVNGQTLGYTNPMGGVIADFDADGLFDLGVSMALAEYGLFQGRNGDFLKDRTDLAGLNFDLHPGSTNPNGGHELAWGTAALDVDRDGLDDLITVHGDDFDSWLHENLGEQSLAVHWNGGGWSFAEISDTAGLTAVGQFRSLTVLDLEEDGDPDLLIGGNGQFPLLYRNEIDAGPDAGNPIAVRLHGTTSNRFGVGATVVFDAGGGVPLVRRVVGGNNGSPGTVSAPVVFGGIGSATEANVIVTWPSGLIHEINGLETGLHDIVEPEIISVDRPDRTGAADGTDTVTITVSPRDRNGDLAAASAVSVEAAFGHAGWVSAVQEQAGVYSRTLSAPSTEGSTVVVVAIDGVDVKIRPRIWWD